MTLAWFHFTYLRETQAVGMRHLYGVESISFIMANDLFQSRDFIVFD